MYIKKRVNVHDDGEIVGIGYGSSKQKGQQNAAKQALIFFNEFKEIDEDSIDEVESFDDIE